jgi:TRAP-type C4-dicarboxylate transport system permease small subunit
LSQAGQRGEQGAGWMMDAFERLIRRIVLIVDGAAAIFLAIITALTFLTVILRYVFNLTLPGSFDIGRLLLGIAIFWGIAVAAYRKEHIQVDIVWSVLPRRWQGILNLFADIVFLGFAGIFAVMFWRQTMVMMASGETTFELDVPIWPFHMVAWLGIALTTVVLAVRIIHVAITRHLDLTGSQGPTASNPLGIPPGEP